LTIVNNNQFKRDPKLHAFGETIKWEVRISCSKITIAGI
jgi:hypothetical protein